MTEREAFCCVVSSGPLLRGDAIVVLSGDGEVRLPVAAQLLKTGGADVIVLSGGLDEPPYSLTSKTMAECMVAMGVHPDRLLLEDVSQNTREQAVNVVLWAIKRDWHRLLLVASPHHSYRAFLTFLQALLDVGKEHEIQLVNVPASHAPWFDAADRFGLLAGEFIKIDAYRAMGHVASYAEGIEYLKAWEGK